MNEKETDIKSYRAIILIIIAGLNIGTDPKDLSHQFLFLVLGNDYLERRRQLQ